MPSTTPPENRTPESAEGSRNPSRSESTPRRFSGAGDDDLILDSPTWMSSRAQGFAERGFARVGGRSRAETGGSEETEASGEPAEAAVIRYEAAFDTLHEAWGVRMRTGGDIGATYVCSCRMDKQGELDAQAIAAALNAAPVSQVGSWGEVAMPEMEGAQARVQELRQQLDTGGSLNMDQMLCVAMADVVEDLSDRLETCGLKDQSGDQSGAQGGERGDDLSDGTSGRGAPDMSKATESEGPQRSAADDRARLLWEREGRN